MAAQGQAALAVRSRRSSGRRSLDELPQARPAARGEEPGHVRGRGRQPAHHAALGARPRRAPGRRRAALVHAGGDASGSGSPSLFANFAEAVAEGRGKAQADTLRKMRKETMARRLVDGRRGERRRLVAAQGRRRGRRGRAADPGRRRDHRGHRLGRRVGHHRRVGAGHPRERRRSLGGHRRHQGALRPHRRPHQRRTRASRSSTA